VDVHFLVHFALPTGHLDDASVPDASPQMATIRKGGKGWQALIRKKNHVGPLSKTFPTKSQAQLWADGVERSLQPPKGLSEKPPAIFKEAIEAYIEGPLKHHRSAHNEKYPLNCRNLNQP